jgi:aspartyl-tRNA(Asn)/glutamyl-tRNA(Gln) amidotransferase subunit B
MWAVQQVESQGAEYSLLDYNRSGVPLIEIVTKPIEGTGVKAPEVARAYVTMLRDLLRALGVSDVRMEEGSLRCDANVSLRPHGTTTFGTRTETKNVNSLRSVERALRYEITRQAAVLGGGGRVIQETRHWHEESGITTAGRSKETAEDYRYFPEPDLVPIAPSREWVEELRATLPEPPAARIDRVSAEWGFSQLEMRDVVSAGAVNAIEATVAAGASPQSARKWWLTEIARRANERGVDLENVGITAQQVAEIQVLVEKGTINDKLARQVFEGVIAGEGSPADVVTTRKLAIVSDENALAAAVNEGDQRESRHRRQDQERQDTSGWCADWIGDEAAARASRRRSGSRVDLGEDRLIKGARRWSWIDREEQKGSQQYEVNDSL